MNPFEFVNAINYTKDNIMTEENESSYNSFLVNRSLSYFKDTVLLANEMNTNHSVANKLQFDFFINTLRKRKRFSKWQKPEVNDNVNVIKLYYGYNEEKARQVLPLLSDNQLDILLKKVGKGGTTR
jgi:hypothetical protein